MKLVALVTGVLLALAPTAAFAEDGEEGFLLRVNGDLTVGRGQVVDSVVVIDGTATIEGTVKDALFVIDGTAVISGTVEGDVTVISGDLDLRSGATVKNVNLIRSDLTRAAGATITGELNQRENFFFRGAAFVFGALFWAGMTVAILVAGALFAAAGGRQLRTAAESLTADLPWTILSAVVAWIGIPILAFIILFTVIGIPLALGLAFFLLPALWFLGYITTGARLGMWLLSFLGRQPSDHPYAAALLGAFILQIVLLVPGIGWFIAGIAGLWGAGGLALVAFRAARGTAPPTPSALQQPAS